MTHEKVSLKPLLDAQKVFERMCILLEKSNPQSPFHEACEIATIKAFEITLELAWKMMQRILAQRGKQVNSPKTTIREAALEGLIKDAECWFDFIEQRNLTSHCYDKEIADDIIADTRLFATELKAFIATIEEQQCSL